VAACCSSCGLSAVKLNENYNYKKICRLPWRLTLPGKVRVNEAVNEGAVLSRIV